MRAPLFFYAIILFCISGCNNKPDCRILLDQIHTNLDSGNIDIVKHLADSIRKECPSEKDLVSKADSFSLIAERILLDFSLTEDQTDQQLKEITGSFSQKEKREWEGRNWLEWRMINGQRKYFKRAVSNLRLIRNFHSGKAYYDSVSSLEPDIITQRLNTESILKESDIHSVPVVPVKMKIEYSLTVHADAVPEGEIIRCWLPYPKGNHNRQTDIRLISASGSDYLIANDSAIHKTIYQEAKAKRGSPTIFSVSYSYKSSGQYFDPERMSIHPYDLSSEVYRKYTSEQPPQICFTKNVRDLAVTIAGSETRPFELIRRFYFWFTNNISWARAQEYSIMPSIPDYVIRNRRGDCGMQTMLFMSMLRYKGIPVRWQSGWKMTPGGKDLHDWCEIYLEGPGWIPVDVYYGLQYSTELKTKEFFISGIDSYRLIVNDGISGPLYPEKKFLRSEPFDFQRGEVEWKGGNIYFDKWDYEMKITYLK